MSVTNVKMDLHLEALDQEFSSISRLEQICFRLMCRTGRQISAYSF
jgi:hypothetical protein